MINMHIVSHIIVRNGLRFDLCMLVLTSSCALFAYILSSAQLMFIMLCCLFFVACYLIFQIFVGYRVILKKITDQLPTKHEYTVEKRSEIVNAICDSIGPCNEQVQRGIINIMDVKLTRGSK